MSQSRTERLVNLVICLLSTRQYLTASRIREIVPGYDAPSDEAFQRTFERDKAELRDLGVPLETGTNSIFDAPDEIGYRIARRDYELPEIRLEPDEAAAVGLAARLWHSGLSAAASSALVKLRAAGIDIDPHATLGVEPVVNAAEPALGPCLDAVQDKRAVVFRYRAARPDAVEERREVEPWGVVSWHGRWYLVGHDRGRGATRVFRLSRITGKVEPTGPSGAVQVPPDVDLVGHVAEAGFDVPDHVAQVRVRRGAGAGLRRIATRRPGAYVSPAPDGQDGAEPYDRLELPYHDHQNLAERLAGYGSDVIVDSPPELRAAVIARLRALTGAAA